MNLCLFSVKTKVIDIASFGKYILTFQAGWIGFCYVHTFDSLKTD